MRQGLYFILILSLTVICLAGCRSPQNKVFGSWHTVSIENPDPFFKNTLPDTRIGSIRVSFLPHKKFQWIDTEYGREITGSYHIENNSIHLTGISNEEALILKFSFNEKEQLVIKTDDGFIFTFEESSDYKK